MRFAGSSYRLLTDALMAEGGEGQGMERRQRRRTPWLALIVAVLCFAIAAGVILFAPSPVDTSHVSHDLTPGYVTLPPTPTAVPPTSTPGK